MNRATELKHFLEKIEKKVVNEEYLRKIYELPSYIFVLVCDALMDRKVTLEIMNEFIYEVEVNCIRERKDVDYDFIIKRLQTDYNPEEIFPELKESKPQMMLACLIKKMLDEEKYVNIKDYIKEIKDIMSEQKREDTIHDKFSEVNVANLIRNLNLEVHLDDNKWQVYRNKLMMKAKEIRNFEKMKEETKDENSLRGINTRLWKLRKEFDDLLLTVKSIEGIE